MLQTSAPRAGQLAEPIDRLDLDWIARAQPPLGGFRWHLEFYCDGAPYLWHGKCHGPHEAERMARADLSHDHPGFSQAGARLVSCAYAAVMWPCACGGLS